MIGVHREKKKGRAKGGIVLEIKNGRNEEKIKWKVGQSKEVLGAKIDRKDGKNLFVIVYMNQEKEKSGEQIEEWIEEDLERRVVIGGEESNRRGL